MVAGIYAMVAGNLPCRQCWHFHTTLPSYEEVAIRYLYRHVQLGGSLSLLKMKWFLLEINHTYYSGIFL